MLIFFYSDPLKKVVLSEVGAFSKNAARAAFLSFFVRGVIWLFGGFSQNLTSDLLPEILTRDKHEERAEKRDLELSKS